MKLILRLVSERLYLKQTSQRAKILTGRMAAGSFRKDRTTVATWRKVILSSTSFDVHET